MSLRDVIDGALIMLALYLVWLGGRLVRSRRAGRRPEVREPAVSTPEGSVRPSFDPVPLPAAPEPPSDRAVTRADMGEGAAAAREIRRLAQRVALLEAHHEALNTRIQALTDELKAVDAAPPVGAMYGEAVAFAKRGYDAAAIAERCGISIAEAQLVRSLAERHPRGT
ncbi:MAG: DUF2802 domain-containing protein [Candidatus Dactylopiibacterium sp.]|nr:DUF2802 domain-containing protein [Candidatus Dactylopiibacterium sp.]